MAGLLTTVTAYQYNIAISEAAGIRSNQVSVAQDVINRECCGVETASARKSCSNNPADYLPPCFKAQGRALRCRRSAPTALRKRRRRSVADQIKQQAGEIIQQLESRAAQSIGGLDALIEGVAGVPGRKTLVIVSAGIPTANYPGARPDVNSETIRAGQLGEKANANLYVLFMDVHFLQQFSSGRYNKGLFDDIQMLSRGLEQFSGAGGGTFYQVEVGPDTVVRRLVRETSAYYLLGVEPTPQERDGNEHFIDIRVNKGGATVRGRKTVTIPKGGTQ